MDQNDNQKPGAPQFVNITVDAAPPAFRHPDIATQYQEGEHPSRLYAEVVDILRDCKLPGPTEAGVIPLTTEALSSLNCIAMIQNGQIVPIVDLLRTQHPTTPAQKMSLCAMAAREILNALIEVLHGLDTGISQHNDERGEGDDEDEGGCHAPVV